MQPPTERKLAAILAADVAGYSRMMEADEAATLASLRACRETIGALIVESRGRVFGTAGDSVLAEFASVVNAVECAIRIQRQLAERNSALPADRQMHFRIGINVGDVMVEVDDLFGEAVNIAARLEGLADPGGIVISASVFEQVRNKLTIGFDYLGPQIVKNISDSVPAWRIVLDGDAAAQPGRAARPVAPEARRTIRERLHRRTALAALLIAVLLVINLFTWSGVLWFKWPALAIAALYALRTIRVGWR